MDHHELDQLWRKTLRSPTQEQFELLAQGVVVLYLSGDSRFRQHIENRFNRVTKRTGVRLDAKNFDLVMARAFIADEIGFKSWDALTERIENSSTEKLPILFLYAIAAMEMGNFSSLESTIGGQEAFDGQIINWFEKGYFAGEQETLAEVFAAACMLGHAKSAEYLLEKGVDPYAGMKTGLAGFHYAASSGRLEVIELLIERRVPMEVRNMYGGTVLGQALWSAVNEYTPDHAAIIEALIDAGAIIEHGTLEWWNDQSVPSFETKRRVALALSNALGA